MSFLKKFLSRGKPILLKQVDLTTSKSEIGICDLAPEAEVIPSPPSSEMLCLTPREYALYLLDKVPVSYQDLAKNGLELMLLADNENVVILEHPSEIIQTLPEHLLRKAQVLLEGLLTTVPKFRAVLFPPPETDGQHKRRACMHADPSDVEVRFLISA